ncbi:hypothetical protein IMY05_009G0136000 [Salix suchowensis]|nr:hypothetical protein IMY05_009G0136000 [Salix suchowensis]
MTRAIKAQALLRNTKTTEKTKTSATPKPCSPLFYSSTKIIFCSLSSQPHNKTSAIPHYCQHSQVKEEWKGAEQFELGSLGYKIPSFSTTES